MLCLGDEPTGVNDLLGGSFFVEIIDEAGIDADGCSCREHERPKWQLGLGRLGR